MSIVTITIRNTNYQIACDDGQESHLQQVARNLDKRINSLAASLGKGSDSLLLVMSSLMMEDEIAELKKSLHAKAAQTASPERPAESDVSITQAMDAIADYIETLAKNMEKH